MNRVLLVEAHRRRWQRNLPVSNQYAVVVEKGIQLLEKINGIDAFNLCPGHLCDFFFSLIMSLSQGLQPLRISLGAAELGDLHNAAVWISQRANFGCAIFAEVLGRAVD